MTEEDFKHRRYMKVLNAICAPRHELIRGLPLLDRRVAAADEAILEEFGDGQGTFKEYLDWSLHGTTPQPEFHKKLTAHIHSVAVDVA